MKIATIHIDPTSDLAALAPARRIFIGLLLLALKDRATILRHVYEPDFSELSYKIDGQWHELIGIPCHLAPMVGEEFRVWMNPSWLSRRLGEEFRRLADHFDPREREQVQYRFMLIIDPIWSIWSVTIHEKSGRGEVTFEVIECTEWAYEQAKQIEIELSPPSRLSGIDMGTGMDGF